jgi:hypothetical protein
MRLLVTIPHFFRPTGASAADGRQHGSSTTDPRPRRDALTACLTAVHQFYGGPQCLIDTRRRRTEPANQRTAGTVDIVVCTTGGHHLLDRLPVGPGAYEHHATGAEPMLLGYECHAILRDRLGRYDYYAYLEDDLVLHDAWFFVKLAWFARHLGNRRLLLPNRYEAGRDQVVRRAYLDGPIAPPPGGKSPRLVSKVLGVPVAFHRAVNPHAGCFFLNAEQMAAWAAKPYFLDRDTSFIGPLESAATRGLVRTFQVYKPAVENAGFLEIEHFGSEFLGMIRMP